jgi:hypothetical protein
MKMSRFILVNRDEALERYEMLEASDLRYRLPYGMWTTEDGEEVIFNRDYRPIWSRHLGVYDARPVNYDRWIENIKDSKYFAKHYADCLGDDKTGRRSRSTLDNAVIAFIHHKPVLDDTKFWNL